MKERTPESMAQREKARRKAGGAPAFDEIGARLFGKLVAAGLREHHTFLDVGCGCLRVGKLLIAYLEQDHYVGVEPDGGMIESGIAHETGLGLIRDKGARFGMSARFDFSEFGMTFDVACAGSILSHTFEASTRACLAGVRAVLEPSGVFHATFIEADSALADAREAVSGRRPGHWTDGAVAYSRGEIAAFGKEAGFGVMFGSTVVVAMTEEGQRWVTFLPRNEGGGE